MRDQRHNKFLHPGWVLIGTAPQQTRQRVRSIWVFIVIFSSRLFMYTEINGASASFVAELYRESKHTHSTFQEWTRIWKSNVKKKNIIFMLHRTITAVSGWARDINTSLYAEQHQFPCWTKYVSLINPIKLQLCFIWCVNRRRISYVPTQFRISVTSV